MGNAVAVEDDGPLWVSLGDSLTQGIGASCIDRSWVHQTRELLAELGRPYRVVNLAATGGRIRDVADRQLDAMAALGRTPDLVTVLVGSNDLIVRSRRETAVADFAGLLERLPVGAVVASMPQPRQAARQMNALLQQATDAGRVRLADMRLLPGWRGALADDHFHPNDVGHARIADIFVKAIMADYYNVG
jgi:lysophospholipase L1-like esterase